MIKFFNRFRFLNLVVLTALYACQQTDAPIAPVKLLPACGIAVISGYTDKTSYFPGDEMQVFLDSKSSKDCGLGFYDTKGELAFGSNVSLFPQTIPAGESWSNGFKYTTNGKFTIPSNVKGGIYFIEKQIPVVIKSHVPNEVTVVYPVNTLNAYNCSGGKSLYGFNSTSGLASPIVSFLRPFNDDSEKDRCIECLKWFPSLPNVSFSYISDQDMETYSTFEGSKILIIAGHSEYWTRKSRRNFDKFITKGSHSIILSGNTMWWQVRYSNSRDEMICYKSSTNDPEPDPLMKTDLWADTKLDYSILASIGADFNHGGYGMRSDNGWDGFKIANPASPLLEGLNLKRGDIVRMPSGECDGAPIKSFDNDGFPVLENVMNFEKLELIGFDKGTRGGAETYPTFIALRHTPTSGIIVNTGAMDWCSSSGIGSSGSGSQIKQITTNAITKLLDGKTVFSN
ncbi:hypothetical protein WSM22_11770 [Cytophagales bacterium WSM2-2]|nr:hypothetical protein WSM22_11770 [Cytophagales bacterium WSM2-2]